MTTNAFTQKLLQASITINPSSTTPTFSGSNSNTVTFGGSGSSAVRMRASIQNAGGFDGTLSLDVWGLPLSIMKQLSTMGMQVNGLPRNQISLSAGDSNGMAQAYLGSILYSIIDFHQPEAVMRISGTVGAAFAAGAANSTGYNGKVSVVTAMQSIAQQMGLTFQNNGVTSQLTNSYLWGSARDHYNMIRQHADIEATIDRGILAIWPKFQNRSGNAVVLSPNDGSLINYPAYTANGVMLQALYNSNFSIGNQVQVNDDALLPQGSKWTVYSMNHMLEAQIDDGKWESTLFAISQGSAIPVNK